MSIPDWNQVVPVGGGCAYAGVARTKVVKHDGRTFLLVLYGAFNAFGLIGSERNGIAVLDEDRLAVVLDDHCLESSGYFGPSSRQWREFERLQRLDAERFLAFVRDHPRARPID